MYLYRPKVKTANGINEVKFPLSTVEGIRDVTLKMPRIRVGSATDLDGTMVMSPSNPLIITVEIIDGKLEVGDEVQICTKNLVTYNSGKKRKYKLRKHWWTKITEENANSRFIRVFIDDYLMDSYGNKSSGRLFKNDGSYDFTHSPLYVRVRRPIYIYGTDNDATFSNIETIWKRYNREGKIFIK